MSSYTCPATLERYTGWSVIIMRLGCLVRADLLMWFTSSGVAVPQEISVAPRGRRGLQLLCISVFFDFNRRIIGI